MEWILDPTAWVGLFTLIVLEIVLGIDNLVFIAILAEKLPHQLRDKARVVGLGLALFMRFFLLMSISYLTSLTKPFITFHSFSFNGRELIMLAGGLFLLYKATVELNERLEGQDEIVHKGKKIARFWPVVAQIVVLDAVFSLDSVITAIGMVHHLEVMLLAVTIAIGIMMWASKPLTRFINAHVTLIILCLSFLLMIGFSLVAEGFGYEIPKGYLYAAIGFSILIEFFNQMSRFNRRRFIRTSRPLRQRTAEVVLRILEGSHEEEMMDHHSANLIADNQGKQTFNQQEKNMIVRIFGLSQRNVGSIMTSRHDITPLDLSSSTTKIAQIIQQNQHNRLVIIDSAISDELLGIIHVNDIAKQSLNQRLTDLRSLVKQPLIFPLKASLLTALEQFRKAQTHFAFVADEFGSVEGVVSLTDVMETIAGNLPTEGEELDPRYDILPDEKGGWIANGYIPLEDLANFIPIPIEDKRDYHTLAGLLQEHTQRLPQEGEKIILDDLLFSILEVENHRLVKVHITQLEDPL